MINPDDDDLIFALAGKIRSEVTETQVDLRDPQDRELLAHELLTFLGQARAGAVVSEDLIYPTTIDRDYDGPEPPLGSILVAQGGRFWLTACNEDSESSKPWALGGSPNARSFTQVLDVADAWTVLRWGMGA